MKIIILTQREEINFFVMDILTILINYLQVVWKFGVVKKEDYAKLEFMFITMNWSKLLTFFQMKSMLVNWKRSNYNKKIVRRQWNEKQSVPINPNFLQTMIIPDNFKKYTNCNENEYFLLFDSELEENRILIFSRHKNIDQ